MFTFLRKVVNELLLIIEWRQPWINQNYRGPVLMRNISWSFKRLARKFNRLNIIQKIQNIKK